MLKKIELRYFYTLLSYYNILIKKTEKMEKIVTLSSSVVCYRLICKRLPVELVKLIELFVNPETDYHRDQIEDIQRHMSLTYSGFPVTRTPFVLRTHRFSERVILNIMRCVGEIPNLFKKMASFRSKLCIGSYGGKHIIEDYRRNQNMEPNAYISNGEFIVAMVLSGFSIKHGERMSPNCDFNAKEVTQRKRKRVV